MVVVVVVVVGTLQCCFVLNTPADSKFIKFIPQSDATWQESATQILLLTTATGISV